MGSVDGAIVPLEDLRVPVTDRGFLLGDAVYETLRTYGGRLYALEPHLDRLEASMRGIRLAAPPARDRVSSWLRATVEAALAEGERGDEEVVARVTVTRGAGPHGMSPKDAGPPQVYILARPLPPAPAELYERGIRVVTARTRRVSRAAQDPSIKAGSALNLILARAEADDAGADEALLLDESGGYLEASAANLFAVRDDTYWTARGEDGVLEGVTMRRIAALLDAAGFEAVRGPVPEQVVRAADEVFLTQTTREVLPVVAVDGKAVGTGRPGPVARAMRERFLTEVHEWLDRP